jgi:uncharacterized protein
MRLYSGTTASLVEDTTKNRIATKLTDAFFHEFRYQPGPSEVSSWRNSLRAVSQVFQEGSLMNHGVILEFQLPLTSRRLDCIITGRNDWTRDNAVIVELKQWDKCEDGGGRNELATWVGGRVRDVLHPSAQVGQYKTYLEDAHTAFDDGSGIQLNACSYLHNYSYEASDVLFADRFKSLLESFPLFTGDDVDNLLVSCTCVSPMATRAKSSRPLNRVGIRLLASC